MTSVSTPIKRRTTTGTGPTATSRDGAPVRDRNIDATVQRVAGALEEEIVLGMLHPRERLVEDDMCERFALKRHVARMVLAELEQRGLVERRKNVGALVKSYTPQEVLDLYAVREILETSAAQRISLPVAPQRLDALIEIQKTHDAAARAGDLRAVFHSNMAFHRALFALTENQALVEAIREYERRTHAIRSGSLLFAHYLEKARVEHHQMIEALAGRDQQRLIELCRSHLTPARDAYLDAYHRRTGNVQTEP
jgi:DNA-binding GntR family transcriptional regulator